MGYYDDLKKGKPSQQSSTPSRSESSGGFYETLKTKGKPTEIKDTEIENRKEQQYREQMSNARLLEIENMAKDQMKNARLMEIENNRKKEAETMPVKPSKPSFIDRTGDTLRSVGRGLRDFREGFEDTLSFGFNRKADELLVDAPFVGNAQREDIEERIARAQEGSTARKAGEIGGYILPGKAIEKGIGMLAKPVVKNLPKLAQRVATLGTAGAIESTAQEGGDVAFRGGKFDPENVAMGAGVGAGLPVLGKFAAGSYRGLTGFAKKAAQDLVEGGLVDARTLDAALRSELPQSVRRTTSAARVPEVFPERFRRTLGQQPSEKLDGAVKTVEARTATQADQPLQQPKQTNPSRGERANYSTQVNEGNFGDEFNQGVANRDRTYPKDTNESQITEANRRVSDLPRAEAEFHANQSPDGNHIATGYRLLQELNRTGQTERALNVADKLASDLTKMGQGTQAASIIKRLSPEGQLLHLQRTATQAGKEVNPEDAKLFTELATDVQKGANSGKDTIDFFHTLDKLKSGVKVSPEEMSQAVKILDEAKQFVKTGKDVRKLPREMNEPRTRDKIVQFLTDKETEALARIKARKNNINSLPLGEWADHAIVASSQIAKGLIKAETYVEDLVREFGEEVRPHAKAIYNEAKRLLGSSAKNISQGKLDEATESFERLRNSQTTPGRVAEKFIKESQIKPGDVEKLRTLAKQLNDLKGKSAQEADMDMQAILNKYQKASAWDRIQAIRYISMLFNSGTQLINAGSGPLMATAHYAADMLGALLEQGIRAGTLGRYKPTTEAYMANPLKFIARYVQNAVVGAKAGARGVSPSGITGTGDIRGLTYKSLLNPLGLLERGLGAVSKGADYATYKTLYQGSLERQAKQAAGKQGLKGADRKEFIEKFLLDPPEKAMEIADRTGKNVTFQRQDRLGGKTAEAVNKLPGYLEAPVKTIVPFIKTPLNMAEAAIDLTPAGAIRGIITLAKKGSTEADKRDAIQRLGLSLVGGGLTATGYYLNQLGIITGNNESGDANVDKLKESVGQGKYRLNTDALGRYFKAMISGEGVKAAEEAAQYQEGDSQIDYNKFQPLALPLAAGASISENKGLGVGSQAQGAIEDTAASLFSMSALRGIQDAFQAPMGSTGVEKVTAPVKRIIESFLKGFSPSLLAQETNRRDDTQRQVSYNESILKDVKEYFMSRTPGLSTKLPAKVDVFGNEIKKPSGFVGAYLNPYRSQAAPSTSHARKLSDLYDSTGDKGVIPKPLTKNVKGTDTTTGEVVSKDIPTELYNRLQKKVGDLQSQMINKIPDNLTPAQKSFLIEKIYEFTRKGATLVAKNELGISVED